VPLRPALASDVSAVVRLLDSAYGPSPTFEQRFSAYRALQPDGWLVFEEASGLLGVGGVPRALVPTLP